MSLITDILKADPIEREKWAHEWLKATAQRIRAVKGNEPLARAEFQALLSDMETILAILVLTMVKDEYQEDVAELIEAIRELQQSLRGASAPMPPAPPAGPGKPGMPY